MKKIKVLFVCMGNICRSPTAQGVFTRLVRERGMEDRFSIDSAGTHAYHVGESPDHRAQVAAHRRGVDIGDLRARQVNHSDFHEFDYILAMDRDNFKLLHSQCPEQLCQKVGLFLDYFPDAQDPDVPDPYYGGDTGFEQVLDIVEAAANGLLDTVSKQYFQRL
ncbi:MAG: low molecular weight phosphotyrosine protein phosphatase [Gammaproteobacteria bacterium]|nr:low molecular weight phosphotyrosine protein phosphatase [Gammaproteobacteria bacterium]